MAAGIFNEDFASNAALTLLPVPVLLLIVALIHFGIPWPKGLSEASGADVSKPAVNPSLDSRSLDSRSEA